MRLAVEPNWLLAIEKCDRLTLRNEGTARRPSVLALGPRLAHGGASRTFQRGYPPAQNRSEIAPLTVVRAPRVERQETSGDVECRNTGLAAVTRSGSVEWTHNAGACVTRLILQYLRDGFSVPAATAYVLLRAKIPA